MVNHIAILTAASTSACIFRVPDLDNCAQVLAAHLVFTMGQQLLSQHLRVLILDIR